MTFGRSGRFYILTRQDNLLAVDLTQDDLVEETAVKTLPPVGKSGKKHNPSLVLSEVLEGVRQANTEFHISYSVKEIHYVEDDGHETHYRKMVKELIQKLALNEEVPEWKNPYKFADG